MVGYIEKSAGGDFAPTPEGVHLMVCSRVIDLGTQSGSQMYPTPRRKVAISWELPDERTEIEGRLLPVMHTERYTWSFHENANLRNMLENWRGKTFTDEDFAGPPNGFHIGKLIGAPMRGQIIHQAKGDKTYANLSTAMAAGIKNRAEWPKLEGAPLLFDLDEFDQKEFDRLSDYYKGLISESPEYRALHGYADDRQGTPASDPARQAPDGYGAGGQPSRDLDGDEIPFNCVRLI